MSSHFRSGIRLGAVLSQTSVHPADELAIATVAEEVIALIRSTSEETFRTLIRNELASPRDASWFRDVLEPYETRYGTTTTTAAEWKESLLGAVAGYWQRGRGLKPFWASRRRALTLLPGGATPKRRRRRPASLRVLQGGAP